AGGGRARRVPAGGRKPRWDGGEGPGGGRRSPLVFPPPPHAGEKPRRDRAAGRPPRRNRRRDTGGGVHGSRRRRLPVDEVVTRTRPRRCRPGWHSCARSPP